jgi:hypothetical protein
VQLIERVYGHQDCDEDGSYDDLLRGWFLQQIRQPPSAHGEGIVAQTIAQGVSEVLYNQLGISSLLWPLLRSWRLATASLKKNVPIITIAQHFANQSLSTLSINHAKLVVADVTLPLKSACLQAGTRTSQCALKPHRSIQGAFACLTQHQQPPAAM